jgi:hypothetical protein
MMKKEVAMENKEGKGDEVGKSEFLGSSTRLRPSWPVCGKICAAGPGQTQNDSLSILKRALRHSAPVLPSSASKNIPC